LADGGAAIELEAKASRQEKKYTTFGTVGK
jgi:hypothetical protein